MKQREKEQHSLRVELSEQEFDARSQLLARKTQAVDRLRDDLKALKKEYADRIEEIEDEIEQLARVVLDRAETRALWCAWHLETVDGRDVMVLRREADGREVKRDAVRAEDRQQSLRLVDESDSAEQ